MAPKMIGKAELISWASETSAVYPCSKYEDFKDGLIFVALFDNLFPGLVDTTAIRVQRSGPRNTKGNWETLRNAAMSVGLPVSVIDKKGVLAGQQRPIYNMLVMFFFLTKLTISSDFTVDFAHPIDDALADFLQSPDSLDCLSKSRRPPPAEGAPTPGVVGARNRSSSPPQNGLSPQQGGMAPPVSSPSGGRGSLAPMEGGSQRHWNSRELGEAGEVTILRLQADVRRLERRSQFLEEELKHQGRAFEMQLEQQRGLTEEESLRAHRAAAQTRATLATEHAAHLRSVRHEADELLEKAREDIALINDQATFDSSSHPEGLRAENTSLRQKNHILESQLSNLRQQLQEQGHLLEAQQNEIAQSRLSLEKLLQTYRNVTSKLHRDSIPDVVFEALSPAEQASLVQFLRQVREEGEAARHAAARMESEVKALQERQSHGGGLHANEVATSIEQSRAAAMLQRANATVSFLRQTVKRLTAGDTVLRDYSHDYAADQLAPGIEAPSTSLKTTTPEEIASALHSVVASLQDKVSPDVMDTLQTVAWKYGCALMALQHRVDRASATIRALHQHSSEADRRAAVLKHDAESRIADLMRQVKRAAEDATRGAAREVSELQLALDLAKSDNDKLRSDAAAMHDRMQANLNAAMHDADRQLQDLRERLVHAEKIANSAKQREELTRQLTELQRRNTDRMSTADRQIHDMRERSLLQQLQGLEASAGLGPRLIAGDGAKDDVTTAVQRATASLRERLEACVEELRAEQQNDQRLKQEISALRLEAERLRQQAAADRDARHDSDAALSIAKKDADRAAEALSTSQAGFHAELEQYQRRVSDLEAYLAELQSQLVEPRRSSHTAPPPPLARRMSFGDPPPSQGRTTTATNDRGYDRTPSTSNAYQQPAATNPFNEPSTSSRPPTPQQPAASNTSSITAARAVGQLFVPQASSPIKGTPLTTNASAPAASTPGPISAAGGSKAPPGLSSGGGGATPSVLSQDELERRKMEILAKYGVKPTTAS